MIDNFPLRKRRKRKKTKIIILLVVLFVSIGIFLSSKQIGISKDFLPEQIGISNPSLEIPLDKAYFSLHVWEDTTPRRVFDDRVYGVYGDMRGDCHIGMFVGENVNYEYCEASFTTKRTTDEKGIIQPTKSYDIKMIINSGTCEVYENATKIDLNQYHKMRCDIVDISYRRRIL
jgi:hypothetical protein